MKRKFSKNCAVFKCSNTYVKNPEKVFIHVPRDITIRTTWLTLARSDRSKFHLKSTSNIYFCEDHFDVCIIYSFGQFLIWYDNV